MLYGHGDDAYRYPHLLANFSSNICQQTDYSALRTHLSARFDVIGNYPEPEPLALERALAVHHNVDPRCVIVTNGATDAIYLVAQAYAHLQYHVCQPTFSEYEDACRMFGLQCVNLKSQTPNLKSQICWTCNPRNPDGHVYSPIDIQALAHSHQILVVDQAYEHYTDLPLLTPREATESKNIIQLHSMTKTYAVPGLRLGYIVANVDITERLRHYLRPWAVNALAIEAGLFLLQHDELQVTPDLSEAQRLRNRIQDFDALCVAPTSTTFMLCQARGITAADLKQLLAERFGLLIRDASNFTTLTPSHFRVAAQSPAQNDLLVSALTQITAAL